MNKEQQARIDKLKAEYEPYRGRYQSPFSYAANAWLELVEFIEQQADEIARMRVQADINISIGQSLIEAQAEISRLRESLDIAVAALREVEEGFRLSIHGNPTCYHIAADALSRIAKQNIASG